MISPSNTCPTGKSFSIFSQGFSCNCLIPSPIRRLETSTSKTTTSIISPGLAIFVGDIFFFQLISETYTRPSTPSFSSTKIPYSVTFVTFPLTRLPTVNSLSTPSHGSFVSCFIPREIRFVSLLNFITITWTFCPIETTSEGWLTRLQAISALCNKPSIPPISTKAP